jgi:DNA-binding MarR family transcriptional regulator
MPLYAHQQNIIEENKPKAGLFLGTGSGKTLTALLLSQGRVLVICPKTNKEDRNWQREAAKNKLKTDLTVMSKEEFRRDHASLPAFNTVIVDEAHTCLGVTPNTRQRKKQIIPKASQLYEALEEYLERTKPERFYLVTATIMRSPMTVWGAARLLGRAWDFYDFRQTFHARLPMPGREVWAVKRDSKTKDRLAKAVQKIGYVGRLNDYFDVPDQNFKTIYLELTEKQRKRIKELELEYPEPIVRVGKIHQVENGVLSGDEFSEPETFENQKIEKILEILSEYPKLVVFAKYRAQIAQIEAVLRREGIPVLTMTGDTKDRGSVIKQANIWTQGVIIVQAQISAGWELPEYPCMVFASRTYSFVDYDQALGRIQRANNIKKNLYINLVVKNGVDEAVNECLENKKDFSERVYTLK